MATDTLSDPSLSGLIKELIDETRSLVKVEAALARDEIHRDISALKLSTVALLLALQLGGVGLLMLLIAAVLGPFQRSPVAALVVGILSLAAAGALAAIGFGRRPKQPLKETQERLSSDLKLIKE